MERKTELDLRLEGVDCFIEKNYGVLHTKSNIFESITDLNRDEKIFKWIDRIEHDKELAGILMINEPDCFGCKAYNKFLSNVSGIELKEDCPEKIEKFENTQVRAIEVNMLMSFIKKFVNFPKLLISCLRGEIVTPFVGLTLVSDYRFFSPSTFFSLQHVKYGLHPSGALPFLLPKYIGQGRAEEILLKGGKINSEEAMSMGLISGIIEEENFTNEARSKAVELFTIDRNVVKSTKDLLFSYRKELYNYFDKEANYLYA